MEILALYESSDSLGSALAAGARHLAATVDGFALVYREDAAASEPDGWAGFTCAQDAQTAGQELDSFRAQAGGSERPLRCDAPEAPARVWSRAAGGVFGFPLRHGGQSQNHSGVCSFLLHAKCVSVGIRTAKKVAVGMRPGDPKICIQIFTLRLGRKR